MAADDRPYGNTVAVLATMHGKERAIGPVLAQGLGLRVALAMGLNTDRFGTFSREVERTGSQLDAARAKIAAGACAWAKSGADQRVAAPGQAKKVAMFGSLDYKTRQLIAHTSKTKRGSDFVADLEQLERLFGPSAGATSRRSR